MPDTAAILNEAYELIEQGELSRARSILQPLLESDSQNPDVWWLYTHAAPDENEGRRALDRVMALDPNYPGATELRERLGTGPRVLKPLTPLKPQPSPVPAPVSSSSTQTSPVVTVPAAVSEPDLDDEFDDTEGSQRSRSGLLIFAGVAILVIAILLVGLSLLNQPQTPTPTDIAGLGTPVDNATLDPLLVPSATIDSLVTPVLLDVSATVTIDDAAATLDPFSETATALLVPANSTLSAQSATEEASLTTSEALASVTEEAPLTTQNALTIDETAEVTVAATQEPLVTAEATLELPMATMDATSESAMSTVEPAATEAVVMTQEVVPTLEVTIEPAATEAVMLTQEATPEATELLMTPTEETSIIVPTQDVAATVEVEATVELTPTEESGLILTEESTAEATQDPLDTLAAKLESLNVTRDDIVIAKTGLGETLIVEVCAPPVATATTSLLTAMSALAESVTDVIGIEAVGVNLSCEETRPFIIAAPAFTAEAYGRGEIDTRTFRQGWAPTDLIQEESNG